MNYRGTGWNRFFDTQKESRAPSLTSSVSVANRPFHSQTPSQMEPKEQVAQLPEKCGVYMFKDAVGLVIYVGKVRSLRNRDKNRKTPGDFSR